MHPGDIHPVGVSEEAQAEMAGTNAFADAVIARLGTRPGSLTAVKMPDEAQRTGVCVRPSVRRKLCGVDMFVAEGAREADTFTARLQEAAQTVLQLKLITNRGVQVWPRLAFPRRGVWHGDPVRARLRPLTPTADGPPGATTRPTRPRRAGPVSCEAVGNEKPRSEW